MIVVSDSSPLISLARANCVYLLPEIFGRVIIPEAVQNELRKAPPGAAELDLQKEKWLSSMAVKDQQQVRSLEELLDRGEAAAIALALQLQADLLLVDERSARTVAQSFGIKVIGVLGSRSRQGVRPTQENCADSGRPR